MADNDFEDAGSGKMERMFMKIKHSSRRTQDSEPVRLLLAEHALAKAVPTSLKKAISNGSAGAVVISVPSAQWVYPLDDAVDSLTDNRLALLRNSEKKNETEDNVSVSRRLAEGGLVVAITSSSRFLPPIFKTVTDHTVAIPPPDAKLVGDVIRRVAVGRVPASFSQVNVGVLDFDDLAALIGNGGDAASIAGKIAQAVENRTRTARVDERLPDMAEATEFGPARLWALDLKADLDDLRNGVIGWQDVDKGCVLFGPPGGGKSLFARCLGEYLGIPVIHASVAEFFAGGAGYLDSVIKQQRAAFEQAKSNSPCVLFLDELDAYPDMNQISNRAKDWWAPVVLDFLQLLDSATSDRTGVIVVGATNRPNAIAPEICRPGRLERLIEMGPPDAAGVERILRHHLEGALADADLSPVSRACAVRRITGAVLMEAVRSARRQARRNDRHVLLSDLRDRLVYTDDRSEADLDRICVHEAGHALIGALYFPQELVSVTVERHDAHSGGYTTFKPSEHLVETDQVISKRIAVLLAGRAAEQVIYNNCSQGAGGGENSDLAQATSMLAAANFSFGIGSAPRWRCGPDNALQYLNIDVQGRREVEDQLQTAYADVHESIRHRTAELRTLAQELKVQKTLSSAKVFALIGVTAPFQNTLTTALAKV